MTDKRFYLNIPLYDPFKRPVPSLPSDIDDGSTVCLILDERWIPYITGALHALTFTDKFQGSDADRELSTKAVYNLIAVIQEAALCTGLNMGIKALRNKPGDLCLIQYLDENDIWQDGYRIDICAGTGGDGGGNSYTATYTEVNNLIQQNKTYVQNIRNIYVNSPGDIEPDTVYDGSANDADRDAALCLTITELVNIYFERFSQYTSGATGNELEWVAAFLGIGIVVTSGWLQIGLGLGAAGVAIGDLLGADQPTTTQLNLDDVKRDAICCLYDKLQDQTVTQDRFNQAFSGCAEQSVPFQIGALALEIINGDGSAAFDAPSDLYLLFIDRFGSNYAALQSGVVVAPNCVCMPTNDYFASNGGDAGPEVNTQSFPDDPITLLPYPGGWQSVDSYGYTNWRRGHNQLIGMEFQFPQAVRVARIKFRTYSFSPTIPIVATVRQQTASPVVTETQTILHDGTYFTDFDFDLSGNSGFDNITTMQADVQYQSSYSAFVAIMAFEIWFDRL